MQADHGADGRRGESDSSERTPLFPMWGQQAEPSACWAWGMRSLRNSRERKGQSSFADTGPEFLLLSICAAAFVVTLAIWCMKPKHPLR